MRNKKKVLLFVIYFIALSFQNGCSSDGDTAEVIVNPDFQEIWQGNSNPGRFQ